MDAIINNPFRVLGLTPSANDKEIAKRVSDLIIYAEMSKNVQFGTDFEFLGYIDRGTLNIKEAAKRLENKELKLFYSLMYFEIKDESDRKAMQFIESKDYKSAINLWGNSIFNNCPVILRGSKVVVDVLKNDDFKNSIKSLYTIKSVFNIHLLPEYEIATHFDHDIKYPLIESFTEFRDLVKYQISCRFKFGLDSPLRKEIGFSLICKEASINHNLIIDSTGNFIFEQEKDEVAPSPVIISREPFNTAFFKEINFLNVKKYDGLLEVWLNDNKVFTTKNHNIYFAFRILMSGQQPFIIKRLLLQELEHLKLYSEDISLNEVTFPYVKNLSLLYILKTEINDTPIFLDYFELIGNIFKQDYFKKYAKLIISPNYVIDFSSLTDIFVQEFYSQFKNRIDPDNKFSALSFYSPFRNISDEAETKAMEILIGGRVYVFEETIKSISSQRLSKAIGSKILAENLIQSATSFFNWFLKFNADFKNDSFLKLQEKVSKELLECGISHYNNTISKSVQIANEAINIIKQSAELSRSLELRERIVKNLNTITKSHGLENVVIDFKEMDSKSYFDSISFKGHKLTEKNSNTIKDHPKVDQNHSNVNQNKVQSSTPNKEKPVERVISKKKHSSSSTGSTLFKKVKKQFTPINIFFGKIHPKVLYVLFLIAWPICFLLIIGLIDYISSSYKSNHIIISKWKENHLENGSSPYDNSLGKAIYDYNSQCWLLFKNGNSTDAIVCLEDVLTGRTIRNEYIQAGTNYTMSNLPTGVYQVKVFYGNDWNPEKTLNNGQIKGAFDSDLSFSISDNISDRIVVKTTEDYSGTTYTTGEITLYKVSNGNMQQRSINSKDFFK